MRLTGLEIDLGNGGPPVLLKFNRPQDWEIGDKLTIRVADDGDGFLLENERTGQLIPVIVDEASNFDLCYWCGQPGETRPDGTFNCSNAKCKI